MLFCVYTVQRALCTLFLVYDEGYIDFCTEYCRGRSQRKALGGKWYSNRHNKKIVRICNESLPDVAAKKDDEEMAMTMTQATKIAVARHRY